MRVCACVSANTAVNTAVLRPFTHVACDSPLGVERYKSRAQNQRIGEVLCRYSSTSCGLFTWCVVCE